MTTFVLRLYDYLHRNRWLCYVLLAAIVVGSVLLTLRLRFNEDISDFLPNDEAYQKSLPSSYSANRQPESIGK